MPQCLNIQGSTSTLLVSLLILLMLGLYFSLIETTNPNILAASSHWPQLSCSVTLWHLDQMTSTACCAWWGCHLLVFIQTFCVSSTFPARFPSWLHKVCNLHCRWFDLGDVLMGPTCTTFRRPRPTHSHSGFTVLFSTIRDTPVQHVCSYTMHMLLYAITCLCSSNPWSLWKILNSKKSVKIHGKVWHQLSLRLLSRTYLARAVLSKSTKPLQTAPSLGHVYTVSICDGGTVVFTQQK